MSWTKEQFANHAKFTFLIGIKKPAKPVQITDASAPVGVVRKKLDLEVGRCIFTVVGDPVPAPRMTQRDSWQQRPCVMRYREYKDRINEAAPNGTSDLDAYALAVVAHIAMPASWSKKKKSTMAGTMHRAKPDFDNLAKSAADSLFKQDSIIANGLVFKKWCYEGQQRTCIKIKYFKKPVLV